MRSGGCAVQQPLAAEAAAVVRQAVALAHRRGHAQVTPLHVASTMLSAAGGLLRAACLRSHSHPLRCKALELCFNVALNRLPAAVMFHHGGYGGGGGHAASPALSNALVAAFKRAQAHQRRGGVEGQQSPPQPVVTGKVELEQLIVSILDDPSVSRAMREAGFSSSQVKDNVKKAVSSSSPEHHHHSTTSPTTSSGHPNNKRLHKAIDDDATRVLDSMSGSGGGTTNRRAVVVVVGESAEGVVKAVMDRVSKGELHLPRHERLKNLQFVPLSIASFQRMATREVVDARAADLRALAHQGCAAGKGVVLVLEDLAYAAEAWAVASERRRNHGDRYCPVEHGVMEVGSLVSAAAAAGRGLDRFWLLGFGDNQAYIKCRAGQPSLEAIWELHPVVVPDGGVALSLSSSASTSSEAHQASQERSRTGGWPYVVNGAAAAADGNDLIAARPNLPQWLRGYQQDSDQNGAESCTTSLQLQEWNRNCNGSAAHPTSELSLSFSSVATTTSPSPSSTSGFANSYNTSMMMMTRKPCQFVPMQPCWPNHRYGDPMANSYDQQQALHANPSPESYMLSNSSESGAGTTVHPKFTEVTAENLKVLCKTLENRVPHHKDIVADIASVVLQCRSGMMTRSTRRRREKPDVATWLLFHGRDTYGKKAVAQEFARLVFGSYTNFISISLLSNYTPVHSKSSSGEVVLKRQRSLGNGPHGYVQRLYDAILENPHRVIMIGGVDQLDCESEISIRSAITNGRITSCNGDEASLEDVIVILSCETLDDSRSTGSSPRLKQRAIDDNESDEGNGRTNIEKGSEPSGFIFDLNACVEDGEGDNEGGASDIPHIVDGLFLFQVTTEDL